MCLKFFNFISRLFNCCESIFTCLFHMTFDGLLHLISVWTATSFTPIHIFLAGGGPLVSLVPGIAIHILNGCSILWVEDTMGLKTQSLFITDGTTVECSFISCAVLFGGWIVIVLSILICLVFGCKRNVIGHHLSKTFKPTIRVKSSY